MLVLRQPVRVGLRVDHLGLALQRLLRMRMISIVLLCERVLAGEEGARALGRAPQLLVAVRSLRRPGGRTPVPWPAKCSMKNLYKTVFSSHKPCSMRFM